MNRTEGCSPDLMDYVARNGHLKVLKWLCDNREECWCDNALVFATETCHFEVVKYLVENDLGLDRLQEAIDADMYSDAKEEEFLEIR